MIELLIVAIVFLLGVAMLGFFALGILLKYWWLILVILAIYYLVRVRKGPTNNWEDYYDG